MRLQQVLKYKTSNDLPTQVYPALSDHFVTLTHTLRDADLPSTLAGVIGIFPFRKPRTEPDSVSFFTFSSNRTAYAALRDVEEIFAEFYLRTGVLPYLNPMPRSFYLNPDTLPRKTRTLFGKQGAFIYGTEE